MTSGVAFPAGFRTGQAINRCFIPPGLPAMSSDPNTNDEDSPPLKRPKSQPGTVAKEISEVDFWDLDEESPANPTGSSTLPPPRQKSILPRQPTKKQAAIPKVKQEEKTAKPIASETPKPAATAKSPFPKSDTLPPKVTKRYPSASSDVFSDKDLESRPTQELPEPQEPEEKPHSALLPEEMAEEAEGIPITPSTEETLKDEAVSSPKADTAAPGETLQDLKKKWNLTQIEKIGLGAFLVLLLGVAAFFLTQGIYKLPEEPKLLGSNGFPVTGQMFSITEAETFWRKPITEGARPDRVRRGTQLIPVLKISLNQGKGAIRVLFRNADHDLVGDGITRAIHGATTLEIPATAGFDDMGMHTAYRTNESKPWNVEVLEAPSTDSPTSQFKKVYESHISAEQR